MVGFTVFIKKPPAEDIQKIDLDPQHNAKEDIPAPCEPPEEVMLDP